MAREIQVKGIGSLPWLEIDRDTMGLFVKAVDIDDAGHIQAIAADMSVLAAVGRSTGSDPAYVAAMMGNLLGAGLTKTANYMAGVWGKYSISGAKSTTFPTGGVVGEAAGRCDGAVVAVVGQHDDDKEARITAMFKVAIDNTNVSIASPTATIDFGLDLYDGRNALGDINYQKGDIRLGGKIKDTAAGNNVLLMRNAGAPTNGTSGTGAGNAGPGSLLIDTTNSKLYINTNTLASPTWTVVGTQTA